MSLVTQIAAAIRNLSDAELCKLAMAHLPGVDAQTNFTPPVLKKAAPSNGNGAAKRKPGRPAGSKNKTKAAPAAAKETPAAPAAAAPAAAEETDETMLSVEMFVRKSKGVAVSEVAESFQIEKEKAASILKKLVIAGRIFRGGERRFSRYAGTAEMAEEASIQARGMAPAAE